MTLFRLFTWPPQKPVKKVNNIEHFLHVANFFFSLKRVKNAKTCCKNLGMAHSLVLFIYSGKSGYGKKLLCMFKCTYVIVAIGHGKKVVICLAMFISYLRQNLRDKHCWREFKRHNSHWQNKFCICKWIFLPTQD